MNCPLCKTKVSSGIRTCPCCGVPLACEGVAPAGARPGQMLPLGGCVHGGMYSVGRVLGQGGFGITYQACDNRRRAVVAIKEFFPLGFAVRVGTHLRPSGSLNPACYAEWRDRFLMEATTLSQFKHPGIVRVWQSFEDNNSAYMVMEFLRGSTLGQMLRVRGVLPESEVLHYASQIAEALVPVHSAQTLHRDIKPDNVVVTQEGRVVLIDFGAARQYVPRHSHRMTEIVTPGYAPLEQYTSRARFGPTVDIYALGATLYHLLTGERPLAAPDRLLGRPFLTPCQMKSSIRSATSEAVMRMLEMDSSRRPQTGGDVLRLLQGGD